MGKISAENIPDKWDILDINDFNEKSCSYGREIFAAIVKMYAEEIPKKIALISSAFETNDINKIKFEAHSLKGIALNFKADKFNSLCIELDRSVFSGDTGISKIVFAEIIGLSQKYITELNRFAASEEPDSDKIKS